MASTTDTRASDRTLLPHYVLTPRSNRTFLLVDVIKRVIFLSCEPSLGQSETLASIFQSDTDEETSEARMQRIRDAFTSEDWRAELSKLMTTDMITRAAELVFQIEMRMRNVIMKELMDMPDTYDTYQKTVKKDRIPFSYHTAFEMEDKGLLDLVQDGPVLVPRLLKAHQP